MSATIVQVASVDAATASNLSCSFASPVTPGNAIYCLGSCIVGPGLLESFTFTDAQGDIFSVIDNQIGLDNTPMSNSIAFNVIGGVTTVNMALLYEHAGDDFASQMIMAEVSGITALDPGLPLQPSHVMSGNNNWGTPGTPLALSSVTVALANPFIIVGCVSICDPANVYSAGTGYSIPSGGQIDTTWSRGLNISCLGIEVANFTTPGVYTPTIVGSGQPGGGLYLPDFGVNAVATFTTSSGPPPPPPQSQVGLPCIQMHNYELTRDVDADWDDQTTFYITQSDPFPFTLRGLVFRIPYNQD